MKQLVIAASMLVMLVGQANAWDNRRHNPPPRQYHHHQHRGINPWVAGALGLGILGAGTYLYNNRTCWDELVGYDRYGRELWQRYCN